ncbi:LysR family transcriptional regulator, partial [Achromobacter sp.]
MDLEPRLLRYFIAVAEERHFSRAAARLHISQPPLSYAIRQLEENIGARLLARTSRHVELTDAGQALYHEALILLRQAEEVRTLVRQVDAGLRGRLRIGFVGSMLYRG